MVPELPPEQNGPRSNDPRSGGDGAQGDDYGAFGSTQGPRNSWAAKLEYAIQHLQRPLLLRLIREIEEDPTLSVEVRAHIANAPIKIVLRGEPLSAPPLFAYLYRENIPSAGIISSFIKIGADIRKADSLETHLLDLVIPRSGNPELIHELVERGARAPRQGAQFSIDVVTEESPNRTYRFPNQRIDPEPRRETVDFRGLVKALNRLYQDAPEDTQHECRKLIQETGRVYDGYVYLRATEEATLLSPELRARTAVGRRFVELTALIFGGRHPREIVGTIQRIEGLMDNHPDIHHWHQSEPELALLVGHPGMNYTDPNDIDVGNALTRSLTSIHRIYFKGIHSLEPSARETIGKLGFLTHAFKFFRYDTEQRRVWLGDGGAIVPGSSILEQFGFERIAPRPTDRRFDEPTRDHLGTGFVIKPFSPVLTSGWLARERDLDPSFYIEFRRAYILASHPGLGTLLIRNSSPLFGRDTFPHFAYWGPTPVSRRDPPLDLLHPEHMIASGRLRPVLTAEGKDYRTISLGLIQSKSVAHLVNGVIAVKDGLRRWKFDTDADSAWDSDPQTGERYPSGAGMHLSEGFPALVQHLVERYRFIDAAESSGYDVAEQLPDLAFYHPYLPAWHPHTYTLTPVPNGPETTRSQLTLSREVLEGLQKLADRNLRRSDVATLERLGVMQFLMAGAQAQAELVMVPPAAKSLGVQE